MRCINCGYPVNEGLYDERYDTYYCDESCLQEYLIEMKSYDLIELHKSMFIH